MSVSIFEIAKKAGVSGATVSRVLNKKEDTRIGGATRERVLSIADELGYSPNTIARSLRTRRTNIIGFYSSKGLAMGLNPFFGEVLNGIRVGCMEWKKEFLLFGDYIGHPEDEVYAKLMGIQLDGLVVHMAPGDPLALRLAASRLPVVAIADCAPPLPSVVTDDRHGSCLLAEHLASKGHRRVMLRRRELADPSGCLSSFRRVVAFHEAASDLGMEVMDTSADYDSRPRLAARERELLTGPAGLRPTAAVCNDDDSAYWLLSDCRELGIRVPEDLAVVGFDGSPAVVDHAPRLTTIRAFWTDVAQTAVSLVMDLQQGKEVPTETVIPVKLIVGDTT